MDITLREAIKAFKQDAFEDNNVINIDISGLDGTDIDANLTKKLSTCQFSEVFKEPIVRHKKVAYKSDKSEREVDVRENVTGIVADYEISKYKLFVTKVHKIGATGGDWEGRQSVSAEYQNALLRKFGKEYALDLKKYAESQIAWKQGTVNVIEKSIATGFETLTLIHKNKEKTFSRKDKELLVNYSQELQKKIKHWFEALNRAEDYLRENEND